MIVLIFIVHFFRRSMLMIEFLLALSAECFYLRNRYWKVSGRDESHTGEGVLYWALVEQAGHEHMSDEYKIRFIIVVLGNPHLWYQIY